MQTCELCGKKTFVIYIYTTFRGTTLRVCAECKDKEEGENETLEKWIRRMRR